MTYKSRPIQKIEQANREFQRISEALRTINQYEVFHVEPAKPRVGLVMYADGTDWDPGSGEGLYVYTSGGWSLLG